MCETKTVNCLIKGSPVVGLFLWMGTVWFLLIVFPMGCLDNGKNFWVKWQLKISQRDEFSIQSSKTFYVCSLYGA
jgi:hypothetical protein